MYFTTFSSYDDNTNNNSNDDEQCLICWENQTKQNRLIKLNTLHTFAPYDKRCSCSSLVHCSCLLEWIHHKQSCPICREQLLPNDLYEIQVTYKTQLYRLFIYINENTLTLIKIVVLIVYINILFDILTNLQYAVESQIENDGNK
jgi:hypothetical protein